METRAPIYGGRTSGKKTRDGMVNNIDEQNAASIPGSKERILFVDDEELFASVGSRLLKRQGYQVTYITDGAEALELFRSRPDEFDLVITDQIMPGMSGLELAQNLIQIRPDIPIILCTGNCKFTEQDAYKAGIRGIMPKPWINTQVEQTIRKMLDGK